MTRTLASFLADRPEAELHEMKAAVRETRQRLQRDLERADWEESVIDDALARKTRRTAPSRAEGSRVKLNREQVLRAVGDHGRPVTIGQAVKLVRDVYPDVSDSAIRTHMHRLLHDNRLVQEGSYWSVNEAHPANVGLLSDLEPTAPPDSKLRAGLFGTDAHQASANGGHPEAEVERRA